MPNYDVTIYREMRVKFNGISAESPSHAAYLGHDRPTSEADLVEDCDGRSFAALVDVAGDSDGVVIDFPQGEIPQHFAKAMLGMLQSAVDHWGEAVRADEPIDGGDAVQWLSGFITAALPLVREIERQAAQHKPEGPAP
ncbi:hypothetical protein [Roseicella sp. DB1501]|uniref:hypothetical protein n=1 Tax=Roseicella sp. DB1501 TaxID=2730925 RepID=UPI001492F1E0|nr:hypothetical protein [Roseicella sp. DB1501]NOG70479.1 hypothetical protein [Roseicella sp. DB1501]